MTPARSRAHLAFIRSLPCCVCAESGWLNTRNIEAAHAPGSRGMAQKRSDFETLPLCRLHHSEQHRVGWPRFIRSYDLDVRNWMLTLQTHPKIVVRWQYLRNQQGGYYMALYRGHECVLNRVDDGLAASLDCAFRICREILIDEVFLSKLKGEDALEQLRRWA